MSAKYVYSFGGGTAEGNGSQKDLLGGKGAGLAEMSRIGIPVPPGFTLTTEVCSFYQDNPRTYPDGLDDEVERHLRRVEERLGRTDSIVEASLARGADARFVYDAYRRLLTMYGDVVLGVPHAEFEKILTATRQENGAATDADLSAEALRSLHPKYLKLIEDRGRRPFPQDARQQLWGAISAVFESWNNPRARDYRRLEHIPDTPGTGVNVQAMVYGNQGWDCATGVAFTRNPANGERKFFGEYLVNAQGEDVVAGIRTPKPVDGQNGDDGLAQEFPQAWARLQEVAATLEG